MRWCRKPRVTEHMSPCHHHPILPSTSTFHFASSPSQPQGAAVWSQQKVQITKYKMSLIMSEIFDETSDPHAAITASTESSNAAERRGIHVPVFESELFISWKVKVIILWPLSTIYRNREQYNRPGICVTVEPCLCYHS